MVLTESKIQRGTYTDWFKRIYISRLMYRDKIFSPQEYQAQVMRLLDQMSEKANDADFSDSITQMLLGGLIPQEYAEYAAAGQWQPYQYTKGKSGTQNPLSLPQNANQSDRIQSHRKTAL